MSRYPNMVSIDGVEYQSADHAAAALNLSIPTVKRRLKDPDRVDWVVLDKRYKAPKSDRKDCYWVVKLTHTPSNKFLVFVSKDPEKEKRSFKGPKGLIHKNVLLRSLWESNPKEEFWNWESTPYPDIKMAKAAMQLLLIQTLDKTHLINLVR